MKIMVILFILIKNIFLKYIISKIYYMLSSSDKKNLLKIMVFYSVLSYFFAPAVGLHFTKTKSGITNGMIVGSVLSIAIWLKFGQKLIELN